MSKYVLVLRTCNQDGKSHNGFQWPKSGPVECPDWDPKPKCGNGLHGLLWGEGNHELLDWSKNAVWLVVKVNQEDLVDLKDNVKFPRGEVVHYGDRKSATDYILANGGWGRAIVGASVVVSDRDRAVVGAKGTATAGDYGTAVVGRHGTAAVGKYGTAKAGKYSKANAGDHGTAVAGDSGTAVSGNYGKATAGANGTAIVGKHGTAIVGIYGSAAAGEGGTVAIRYTDEEGSENAVIGKVGEDGILPNTLYVVREGKLVHADK